jgi:hypothetical protein
VSRQDRFHRRPRQRTSASQAQDAFRRRLLADFCNQTFVREHNLGSPEPRLARSKLPSHAPSALRSRAPGAVRQGLTPAGTEWWCFEDQPPYGGCSVKAPPAELGGSGARSTLGAAQAVFPRDCSRVERATPTRILLKHLLSRARDDAGWRGRRAGTPSSRCPVTNPPGYEAKPGFPSPTPLEPARACFREARPPRKTLLARGLFGDQSRFSPASAKSRAMSRTQGAFHRGETRARWVWRAANHAPPCARLWDRSPQ